MGACIGASCAPASQRRRGAIYGACLGTLPDLDVLLPTADPVTAMVTHRSFSHSLLVLTLVSPLLHWLLARMDRNLLTERHCWRLAFWLALITHPLLDWCTTYGTQLLWPLDRTPYALANVFIIDPFYTLPLLLVTLLVLCKVRPQRQLAWARWALAGTTAYLCWGLLAHAWVSARAREAVVFLDLPADTVVHVSPAPLNTLLWRVLLVPPQGGWHEGWYSVLSDAGVNDLVHHPGLSGQGLDLPDLRRLSAFSSGAFALRESDGQLWYADLRMGTHPWFVFRFALAQRDPAGHWRPLAPAEQAPMTRPPLRNLGWIVRRIFDPELRLPEAADPVWQ